MLASAALYELTQGLANSLASMGVLAAEFGKPELVQFAARETEKTFQGYSKAKPSKEDAYAAALAYMQAKTLSSWQRDLVASALVEPIREVGGSMVLGTKRFPDLLETYEEEAKRGELWRLTWHGLLYSYFNYDPNRAKGAAGKEGWEALRLFLERTWPWIDRQAGKDLVPEWVKVLRQESEVLSRAPVERYARAYLAGDTEPTQRLAADLGIPPSSWFWHALVLGAVQSAVRASDAEFRRHIPALIKLIEGKPAFRDEALEAILVRYHACAGAPVDAQLRDYVCQPSVWKNPKLKAAGYATAWNRVPDAVWQMVLGWVNKQNLKDFFDVLAARNSADEGRLAFWSRYLEQISWTRLGFGSDTLALQRSNAEIRQLIAREEGAYARLTHKTDVDAFMMQIGDFIIVEFSKKPNACYVYEADQLPFEPYAKEYSGSTADLSAGYRQGCSARIVHTPGWDARAEGELRRLGIRPDSIAAKVAAELRELSQDLKNWKSADTAKPMDRPSIPKTSSDSASSTPSVQSTFAQALGKGPDMGALNALLARYPFASIDDRRSSSGGRLWVEDPLQSKPLGHALVQLGFKWANSRQAWYFLER